MPFSVLAVDDRPEVLHLLKVWIDCDDRLELVGTAVDGHTAMQWVAEQCPDAIICDVQMPGLGGLEALPSLREACPHAVILMYTSAPEISAVAQRLGADAVVDKSSDVGSILDYLSALCRNRA
jgi:two-component system, chemotaxis family, protein-glutamate methylesterase/glutaminase